MKAKIFRFRDEEYKLLPNHDIETFPRFGSTLEQLCWLEKNTYPRGRQRARTRIAGLNLRTN